MGRRINTLGLQATGGSVDGYFDKIIKYIPSDIVAAWTAAIGIIVTNGANAADYKNLLLIAFAVGLILTAGWTWFQTKAPGQPTAIRHIIASTISFAVWAFALPVGPSVAIPNWESKWGSLILIAWTLVLGKIPGDPTNPPAIPTPTPEP